MTTMHPGRRSVRIAAALGAMLVIASCANVPGRTLDSRAALDKRFDGGVGQLMHYCTKLRDSGNLAMAAGVCERAHNLDPADPEPLLLLADILADMGEIEQAAEAYRILIGANPEHVEARYRLGKTYIALEQYDLALGELQTALRRKPDDARLYNALGIANGLLGGHASAQEIFEAGLQIAPDNVSLRNNMGLSMVLAGRHDEGLALLEAVAADPSAGRASLDNLQLARGLAIAAKSDEALALADPPVGPALVDSDANYSLPPEAEAPADADLDGGVAVARNNGARPGAVMARVEVQPVDSRILSAPTPLTGPLLSSRTVSQWATAAATDDGAATPATPGGPTTAGPAAPMSDIGDMHAARDPDAEPAVQMARLGTGDTEPGAAPPGTAGGSHVIQFASFRSEDSAQRGWNTISADAPDLLGTVSPVIQRADLGPETGVFYRLRTGLTAKADADRLCGDLKSRGVDCLVIKVEPGVARALDEAADGVDEDSAGNIEADVANATSDDMPDTVSDDASEDVVEESGDDVVDEPADDMADESPDELIEEIEDPDAARL